MEGSEAASLILNRLRECHTSPTVLYWLQLRASTLSNTEFGAALLDLCKQLGVNPKPNVDFYRVVNKAMESLSPITPSFYSVDFKKENAIKKFSEELHKKRGVAKDDGPDPFAYLGASMPFCFQCLRPKSDKNKCAFSGSLFFIFSTLEDGLRMIHQILGRGNYTHEGVRHEFSQVCARVLA
jgi:hypothetical protein